MSFIHVETIELTSDQSNITFNNIPQNHRDLFLLLSLRSNRSANFDDFVIAPNSTNGTSVILGGNGSSVFTFTQPSILNGGSAGNNTLANGFGNSEVLITDYASSNKKSVSLNGSLSENSSNLRAYFSGGYFNDTSPITSVFIRPGDGSVFKAGTKIILYGIGQLT